MTPTILPTASQNQYCPPRTHTRSGDAAVLGSYDAKAGGKRGAQLAGGVPVADMGAASPYARDTLALTDRVLAFAALNGDPANPERIQVGLRAGWEDGGRLGKAGVGGCDWPRPGGGEAEVVRVPRPPAPRACLSQCLHSHPLFHACPAVAPTRLQLVKELKTEFPGWVSK